MSPRPPPAPQRTPVALRRARPPDEVLEVLRRLLEAGHRSWIVGGAVRDLLLRRGRGADHDVATPARPEEVLALFPRALPTGVEHGTVTVLLGGGAVEVTTFRGEGAYLDGRRPSSVSFHADLDADLARRDFTVNALAWDPLAGLFRDPFGGRRDLRRGVLRAVGDPAARFAEDGLRPLRAARLAAQLGFALDPRTAAAIPAALDVARRVSAERVAEELSKLLAGRHARHGLAVLEAGGLLGVVLPEVAALPPALRRHALDAAGAGAGGRIARFAALLHALAADAPAAEAARAARAALERLRLPREVSDGAAALVELQGCLAAGAERGAAGRRDDDPFASDAAARRWLAAAGRPRAPDALAVWERCARALRPPARSRAARAALRRARARLARVERARPPLSAAELALDGRAVMRALGLERGGPRVGEALRFLLDHALEDPAVNTPEQLAALLDRLPGAPER